ncbi:MAG: NUMOD4 motif-containing HNH endonuclease, partial [Gemmatimonadaceae bacterium]|nr:NUMOD4 motif-containing HNH endonuclease [Gemmatimonadaceae bacterium]
MSETWLPVVGWEGVYEISDLGRVKRVAVSRYNSGGILSPCNHPLNGYTSVHLRHLVRNDQPKVHRLVLAAFVGPCPPGQQCNHKNGKRDDNRLANLEWVTPSE